jgi:ABC-type lipoprotein export system ATPase subunit
VTHDPQAVEYVDHAYTLSDGKLQEGISPELALP